MATAEAPTRVHGMFLRQPIFHKTSKETDRRVMARPQWASSPLFELDEASCELEELDRIEHDPMAQQAARGSQEQEGQQSQQQQPATSQEQPLPALGDDGRIARIQQRYERLTRGVD